jgi:hypothetical protein
VAYEELKALTAQNSERGPIPGLEAALEKTRLEEIERLASKSVKNGPISIDALGPLASVQIALMAVREEIALHDTKLGGGSEKPLR